MPQAKERFWKTQVVVLLLIATFVMGTFWTMSLKDSPLRFNSRAWKEDTQEAFRYRQASESRRDRMVDDFLKRHSLEGMSRTAVVSLLGEPDASRRDPFLNWDLIYWLGPDVRGLALDSKWLLLQLDQSNSIVDFKITND